MVKRRLLVLTILCLCAFSAFSLDSGDRNIFYVGLRAGLNMPQYSPVGSSADDVVESGGMFDTLEPEAALFFGVQIADWLALQTDYVYTMTSAVASNGERVTRSFSSGVDLMIAAQLNLTFRPGKLLIAVGGGAYIDLYPAGFTTIPYEDGKPMEDGAVSTPLVNAPILGWTAGMTVGMKLGPGELFVQGQVYGDLTDTGLGVAGEEEVYHRRTLMPSVSIGYQIAFGTVSHDRLQSKGRSSGTVCRAPTTSECRCSGE
jgi:hypothetical protein